MPRAASAGAADALPQGPGTPLAHLAALAGDDEVDSFYWDLFHAIRSEVPCDAFGIDLLDVATGVFLGTFYVDTIQGHHRRVEAPTLDPRDIDFLRSVADGTPRLVLHQTDAADAPSDSIASWGGKNHPRPSLMFVALRRPSGQPVGILTVQSYDDEAYGERDLARLERLAAAHAEAIHHRQEAERAGQEVQELRACERLLTTLQDRDDLGDVLGDTLAEAVSFLRAHTGAIYLLQDRELRLEVSHGLTTRSLSQLRVLRAADHPHYFAPFVRREPISAALGRLGDAEKRLGLQCLAGTPIRQGHRILGTILLGSLSYHGFTGDALRFLARLATHVASTVGACLETRAAELHEARIRAYFDSRPEAIIITSPDGTVRDWNTAGAALMMADPGTPSGRPVTEFFDFGGADALPRLLAAARRERTVHGECRPLTLVSAGAPRVPTGEAARLRILPIFGAATVEPESFAFQLHAPGSGSGEREAAVGASADPLGPPASPAPAPLASASSDRLLAALADVVFTARPGDPPVFQSITGAMDAWLGRPAADLLVDPFLWGERVLEEDRDAVAERLALVARGRPYSLQYRIRDAKDAPRLIQEVGVPLLDEDGCLDAILGAWTELGPERRIEHRFAEERVLTIQRLLAGGAAHRIENVATVIAAAVTQGRRLVGDSGPGAGALRLVETAGRAALDLAHSLQDVAGLADPQREAVDVADLIGGLLPAIHASRLRGHRLDYRLATDLPRVMADRQMLRRALGELIDNAIESRHERSRITIVTQRGARWAASPNAPEGVVVAIEDAGPGPRHLLQQRVPIAFASTKAPGRGLGLVVAAEIARALGGELTVGAATDEGHGATARLWLPAPTDPSDTGRTTTSQAAPRPAVILLEPDPLVRDLVAGQLDALGLSVVPTQSSAEALALLHQGPGRWQLVVYSADDPLGDMTPARFATRLRELQPGLPLLALGSGHEPDPAGTAAGESKESDPDPVTTLRKPFRLDDLSSMLRRLGVTVRRRSRGSADETGGVGPGAKGVAR